MQNIFLERTVSAELVSISYKAVFLSISKVSQEPYPGITFHPTVYLMSVELQIQPKAMGRHQLMSALLLILRTQTYCSV